MTIRQHPVRVLVALLGALALLVTTALAIGSIRPTEATWSDRAVGAAEFGVSPSAGENFARSASTFGVLKPWISGANTIGSVQREVTPSGGWIARSTTPSSWSTESVGNAFTSVRASAETRTCARRENRLPDDCRPLPDHPETGAAASHAVSQVRNVNASALALLARVPLVRTSSDPITATASCTPGQVGRAGIAGEAVMIGGGLFDSGDRIAIPAQGRQTTFTRDIGLYTYYGVLQHHHVVSNGYAMSQLRLYVEASGDVLGSQPWVLHLVLAHAECGTSRSVTSTPARPGLSWPAPLPEHSARMVSFQANGVSAPPAVEAEPQPPAETDDAPLPSLPPLEESPEESPDAPEAAGTTGGIPTATSSPAHPRSTTTTTPTTTAADPSVARETESAQSDSSEPSTPASDNRTGESPRLPVTVAPGRSFTVVGRDGVELGSARIDDIERTPGCGVALTLSIITSAEAGPERWSSLGPGDFAELRSSGATRDARTVDPECPQSGASTTTRLSPDREYKIVLAFQLDDSAQQAMLRPEGTAGWAFDLPPLTTVAVVATTVAATTTAPVPAAGQSPATSTPPAGAPATVTHTVESGA